MQDFPTFGWGLSLRLGAHWRAFTIWERDFPTFGWGLSLRPDALASIAYLSFVFPHLRVGTFIEAPCYALLVLRYRNFPTFGWGLSLRPAKPPDLSPLTLPFPHLRVGTFIEAILATG